MDANRIVDSCLKSRVRSVRFLKHVKYQVAPCTHLTLSSALSFFFSFSFPLFISFFLVPCVSSHFSLPFSSLFSRGEQRLAPFLPRS